MNNQSATSISLLSVTHCMCMYGWHELVSEYTLTRCSVVRHETYSYNTSVLPFLQFMYQFAGATAYSTAYFGRGTGGIYLDSLGCRGSELRLMDCSHSVIGVHNCYHSEDASLRCQRKANEIDFKTTVFCNASLQPVNRTSYVRHFARLLVG